MPSKSSPKRKSTPRKASSKGATRKKTTKKKATGARTARRSSSSKPAITNYSTALKWLYEHTDFERMRLVKYNSTTFNLARMQRLLKALDNPHKQLNFVHIAGTKGKGSTIAMLSSMLQANGYTIGSYTSPHLVDLRERITIDGQMITHAELTELFKLVKSKAKSMAGDEPTFFEILTAAAIRHFADQAVDLAILETGLGGRLDSTNVVNPLVCGITQISYDHTNILGKELTTIAGEKAGIMKKNVPVITCEQTPEVHKVFEETAEQVGAPLNVTGSDIEFSYRFEANRELGPHTRVCLTTPRSTYDHLAVPLKGEHQALNCGLAIAILDKLAEKGFKTTEEKLIEGLSKTELPGRMEIVWPEPRILIDGAHNASSINALIRSIGAHVPYDSLVMVFGCAQDKDIKGMLEQVNLGADKIIFTRSKSNPRATEPKELLHHFSEVSGKMAQTADNLEDALNLAARAVTREDMICVTGSFHLVGEAKKYLADLATKREKQNA